MKESYFIDNVDLEWCFRAKSLGFDLVGTDGAVLYHAIGERENPLVRAGFMAQHNPPHLLFQPQSDASLSAKLFAPGLEAA